MKPIRRDKWDYGAFAIAAGGMAISLACSALGYFARQHWCDSFDSYLTFVVVAAIFFLAGRASLRKSINEKDDA
jgi:hypothetical protein